MNMLSLDHERIIVEKQAEPLQRALREWASQLHENDVSTRKARQVSTLLLQQRVSCSAAPAESARDPAAPEQDLHRYRVEPRGRRCSVPAATIGEIMSTRFVNALMLVASLGCAAPAPTATTPPTSPAPAPPATPAPDPAPAA